MTNRKSQYSIKTIKTAAQSRTIDILVDVAGISPDILDETKREYPCPKCGGKTRFRMLDRKVGAAFCSHCFKDKNDGNGGDFISAVQWMRNVSFPEALQLIGDYLSAAQPPKNTAKSKVVSVHDYQNADGTVAYQVRRFEPGRNGKSKECIPYHLENGKWKKGNKGIELVPLHLPELLQRKNEMVFIVEGEKCFDTLIKAELFATTASGGSNSPLKWENFLTGRTVIILPDNDYCGYDYADRTAALYKTNTVKVVKFTGLKEAGDVVDWLAAGHSTEELLQIVEQTPIWDGTHPNHTNNTDVANWDFFLKSIKSTAEIVNTEYSPICWIVRDLIPVGLTILAGASKIGKSWLILTLVLLVASGRKFLDMETTLNSVLYLALEDSERRIKTRIKTLGIESSKKARIITIWQDGVASLRYYLKQHPEIHLVVIDTWARFCPKLKDGNDYQEVTRYAVELQDLAKELDIGIIVLHHTSKSGNEKTDWMDSVLGSKGLVAVADTIIKLERNRGESNGILSVTGRDVSETEIFLEHDDNFRWSKSETQNRDELERQDVLEVIRSNGGCITVRELRSKKYQKNYSKADSILTDLTRVGALRRESEKSPNGGRAKDVFYLVDSYTYTTTPKNTGKNESCGIGISGIEEKSKPDCTLWESVDLVEMEPPLPSPVVV